MNNRYTLRKKRILITGASSGIGKSCAELFAHLGASMVLVSKNKERLQAAAADISGSDHHIAPFDLSDIEGISEWLIGLAKDIGPLDGLVHSAGIQVTLPIRATKIKAYREVMKINLDSAYLLAKTFRLKKVRRSPAGIVFISSIAGIVGMAGLSAYSASKSGLVGLSRSLAIELARDNVRVNCISPGFIETKMMKDYLRTQTDDQIAALKSNYPLGLGKPEDVANAAAFLISDLGRWITGVNLPVDGGYTAH